MRLDPKRAPVVLIAVDNCGIPAPVTKEVKRLLKRVETGIGKAPNRVKYCMNSFVIAVGSYVKPLAKEAKALARKLGKVEVDMGDTYCKVPVALDYIAKVEKAGKAYKKRKTIRC